MPSALYYPHTYIGNESLIKTALLLWDTIEYIVPQKSTSGHPYLGEHYEKAIEIVGRPHIPTVAEKNAAHIKIKDFVKEGLPKVFYQIENDLLSGDNRHCLSRQKKDELNVPTYLIYPDKFDEQTWSLLKREGLAFWDEIYGDYRVPPAFGFLMMSMLADVCAGTQILKITDRVEAYNWLEEQATNKFGGKYSSNIGASAISSDYDRLITLSIKVLDTGNLSINSLLDMREREARSNSRDLINFRRNYLSEITKYIERIGNEAKAERDVDEINKQFEDAMKDDLTELKRELNIAVSGVLLSREVGVSIMALAGTFLGSILGIPALSMGANLLGVGVVGPFIRKGLDHQEARRNAFKKHPMSWLYLNQRNPNIIT